MKLSERLEKVTGVARILHLRAQVAVEVTGTARSEIPGVDDEGAPGVKPAWALSTLVELLEAVSTRDWQMR